MSREIRRVPQDWQHPRRANGQYEPLHDGYCRAVASFKDDPDDWDDEPDPNDYMPEFGESATAYQVYETVSEGTPVSPVLPNRDRLRDWLMNDGSGLGIGGRRMPLTRAQAESFMENAYAPSMVYSAATGLVSGLEAQTDQ